ncbi:MAG: hypothetical protein ACRD11_15425 [Terriglobia bacterium]
MKKFLLSIMALSLFAFLGGASVLAKPALQDTSTPQTPSTTTAPAAKNHVHHAMHHHMKKAAGTNYTAKYAAGVQELSGTLESVEAGQKVLVITDSNGTPFNIKVNRATKIEMNGKKSTLDELSGSTSQQVTVKYRDRLNAGLVAASVSVGG